jgi:phage tail sheath gpL-like
VSDIVLAGLAANDPVPNPAYVELNFAQGVSSGDASAYEVLLLGNKTTAGSAIVDTEVYGPDSLIPMQTEADVITLFGSGSEVHRMWRRFTKINKDTTLRAIAVTESAGTAASATCVLTTTATANGSVRIWVGDEFVDASVTSGDVIATVGAAMAAAINSMTAWAVTAAFVTATLTITAKQKGLRGNDIRYQIAGTPGIGTTFSTGATDTALAGGATADSNAAALTAILPDRYYYIVSAASDATQVGALLTQVNSQALATTGIRQRVFTASTDTLANAITFATGLNGARAECVWHKSADWTPAELAANHAAIMSALEVKPNPRTNYCNFGQRSADQTFWVVPPQRLTSARPTRSDIKSALNNGLSPIGVIKKTASTYLSNRITTRSLNGSQPDYRIRPAHKVTICDFFCDDLVAVLTTRFGSKKMGDDVPQGTPPLSSDFVTPDRMRGAINGVIGQYDSNGLWQPGGAARMKLTMDVRRGIAPTTRMGIRINAEPVDNFEQGAVQVNQIA